jgi:hypothetical protein
MTSLPSTRTVFDANWYQAAPDRLEAAFRECLEEKFSEVRLSHMTADRPELVRHTGAVDDQRGSAEG